MIENLERILEELDEATRLLEEVDNIGLWSRSDDTSDNRRRRQGLREVDWTIASAGRRLAAMQPRSPELDRLHTDAVALDAWLETLPDLVSDTMLDGSLLYAPIHDALDRIAALRERVLAFATSTSLHLDRDIPRP